MFKGAKETMATFFAKIFDKIDKNAHETTIITGLKKAFEQSVLTVNCNHNFYLTLPSKARMHHVLHENGHLNPLELR